MAKTSNIQRLPNKIPNSTYKKRLKALAAKIKKETEPTALLLEAAPERMRSLGHDHYLQNMDFLYLTGSDCRPGLILISNRIEEIRLLTPKTKPSDKIWNGKKESPQQLSKRIDLEFINTGDGSLLSTAFDQLKGHSQVYLSSLPGTLSNSIANQLNNLDAHKKLFFPKNILDLGGLIAEQRLIKDSHEISLIKHAIHITDTSLQVFREEISSGAREKDLAALLEYNFRRNDATGPAFPSIIAGGANSSVLHYVNYTGRLKAGSHVLVDCGAEFNGYSADITRCYPVSSELKEPYRSIYNIVDAAKMAACKKVKHKADIKTVFNAAAKELVIGLKSLGVLKGNTSTLLNKRAYLPYFMHSIGHSLGLDTHDPGGHREGQKRLLLKNMVFTIEPGLYFQKKTGKIPAGGIRLEDDILVTARGHENLSAHVV